MWFTRWWKMWNLLLRQVLVRRRMVGLTWYSNYHCHSCVSATLCGTKHSLPSLYDWQPWFSLFWERQWYLEELVPNPLSWPVLRGEPYGAPADAAVWPDNVANAKLCQLLKAKNEIETLIVCKWALFSEQRSIFPCFPPSYHYDAFSIHFLRSTVDPTCH